jgi:predicted O-methyltransferase YrrM
MTQEHWSEIDRYITDSLLDADPVLTAALQASDAAGLPAINVAPNQGKLLQLLALSLGARKILEIGTLGGYSTIWLARALKAGGRLISLEVDAKHAEVARANLARAELSAVAEVRVGRAIDRLPELSDEAPFDLTFIDADKASIPDYFIGALKLSRVGSLIIVDNVIRKGAVLDANSQDANVQGVRRLNELVKREPRVKATALQTVGSKGHDGLLFALVVS